MTQAPTRPNSPHHIFWRLLAAWLFGMQIAACHAQSIAFTFDDGFDTANDIANAATDNAAILTALKKHKVRAMLFPSGPALDNPGNIALVREWSNSGHSIGNHTYNHAALSKTGTEQYFADVEHAQSVLQTLPGWCPRLRFPYLDEGKSETQHNHAMEWLGKHGYGVAAATIFLPDWEFAQQYLDTQRNGSETEAASFRQAYLQHVWTQIAKQDTHWIEILGRSPAHVLLLHTNHLNATVLPDLMQLLEHKGWQFIDAAAAFMDPIYQRDFISSESIHQQPSKVPNPGCR